MEARKVLVGTGANPMLKNANRYTAIDQANHYKRHDVARFLTEWVRRQATRRLKGAGVVGAKTVESKSLSDKIADEVARLIDKYRGEVFATKLNGDSVRVVVHDLVGTFVKEFDAPLSEYSGIRDALKALGIRIRKKFRERR